MFSSSSFSFFIYVFADGTYVSSDGKLLTVSWEKMSKSKYNGIDPEVSLFFTLFDDHRNDLDCKRNALFTSLSNPNSC